ncbi:MAG: ATPase [Tannerellaceae bacterium]|jgi:N-acetylglucosamine kinase-like BadF-type ATPase|nr:ATPase [Tannerellaceae bacterium]
MILLADSGSTKTEWRITDKGKSIKRILAPGMNPYFQQPDEIGKVIEQKLLPEINGFAIEAVYFYGAGCAVPEKNRLIRDAIRHYLPCPVEVCSDLTGAARALCGKQAGIACILGTGSNSCFYDGKDIVRNISPLGFILGDEGSGAVLGKLLVGDCLKNQLPLHLKNKFIKQFRLTPEAVLEHVYKQPFPNRYLAGFSKFLIQNIKEPALYNLAYNSFRSFFIRNVMQYDHYRDYPISFTGSIAFYYQDVLLAAARSFSLPVEQITQTPMEGLLFYHS